MERLLIKREDTTYFSNFANRINSQQEQLKKYVQAPVSIENFQTQIDRKKKAFSTEQRKVTQQVIARQLDNFTHFNRVKENIELLKDENTFTVTAGHQLGLYGGPLYLIYKIMDTVRLTAELKRNYPDYNFVPIFWTATEDHDFEEINHLHLFHDTITWESEQKGPVGRFSLKDIHGFKEGILQKFGNNPEFAEFLDTFYQENESYAEANTRFLMELVGDYGVLVLDADDHDLKKSFLPYLKRELTEQFSEPEILAKIEALEKDGFYGQATPRPINLFYIKDQFRERIIPLENGDFEIGEKTVSHEKLLEEVEEFPERFSPNVVMRPLYQECILPNLCYLGGGGEMAYWLQLKGMFEQTDIPFPLIKVRNSIQWFDKGTIKKIKKLGLTYKEVFQSIHENKKQYVIEKAGDDLDFTAFDEKVELLTQEVLSMVENLDKGLTGYAKAETTRLQNQMDKIKQKLIRHQKQQNDDAMAQIDSIYERLFPNNNLQERFENMIPYLAKFGKQEYIKMVYDLIDPMETDLILAIES